MPGRCACTRSTTSRAPKHLLRGRYVPRRPDRHAGHRRRDRQPVPAPERRPVHRAPPDPAPGDLEPEPRPTSSAWLGGVRQRRARRARRHEGGDPGDPARSRGARLADLGRHHQGDAARVVPAPRAPGARVRRRQPRRHVSDRRTAARRTTSASGRSARRRCSTSSCRTTSPTGIIADAGLFAPEFQIITAVTAITSANALRGQIRGVDELRRRTTRSRSASTSPTRSRSRRLRAR